MAATVGIVKSFWASMAKLPPKDIQAAAEFASKFQENPANPGLSLEHIQRAKDKHIWSARINANARAVVYHDSASWLLLYAGTHEEAYRWGEHKKVAAHERTGALQIYDLPEVPSPPAQPAPKPKAAETKKALLFDRCVDGYLSGLGVPAEWLPRVRSLETEDDLLGVIGGLPEPVAERLLRVATGEAVAELPAPPPSIAPTENEDFRRICLLNDSTEELRRLLEAPTALWIGYLHPTQRRLATGTFSGPAKVTGSAGTGKTVVALHRARHLAREGKRVLLTSFVTTLCQNLEANLRLFCTPEELARITVSNAHKIALELYQKQGGTLAPGDSAFTEILEASCKAARCPFDVPLVREEWDTILQAQGIETWDAYRAASRAGRGFALSVADRKVLWDVFDRTRAALLSRDLTTFADMCRHARLALEARRLKSPFDSVVVDEVQDLGPEELRFLAALAGTGTDRLFLVGDAGQRIYAGKLSLRSLGIDVRGRSHVLRITYRTSEEIRRFSERILDGTADDMDGAEESRSGTVALFTGPRPVLKGFASAADEVAWIAEEIGKAIKRGTGPGEIAVFARTRKGTLEAVEKALAERTIPAAKLESEKKSADAAVRLGTMHRAKGLEFKIVFVAGVDEGHMPHARAVPETKDERLRADALLKERQLLYVSATRARNAVHVTWTGKPSPFLATTEGRRQEKM